MPGGGKSFLQFGVDAEAGGGVCELTEEGGGELVFAARLLAGGSTELGGRGSGRAYAAVEAEEAVGLDDMADHLEHAARGIGGAGLKADLQRREYKHPA